MSLYRKLLLLLKPAVTTILRTGFSSSMWSLLPFPGGNLPLHSKWKGSQCLCIPHLFIHSSVEGHVGCFHVLAMVNSAAMNIGMHVSFWAMFFFGYMSRSGIARSYGSSIFSFLRNKSIFNNMDEYREHHTEWSKSDWEGEMSYDTPYPWNLKKKWYKWTYKTERDS